MELRKLDHSFYIDNLNVKHALDFDMESEAWTGAKVRGHGVVQITTNGLTFAIPVRSYIKHNASLILEVSKNREVKGMGLDYSKSLLIKDPKHISNNIFLLKSKTAGKNLVGKESHVTKQFTKYVENYVSAVKKNDKFILNSFSYKYSTLINYHKELGIE